MSSSLPEPTPRTGSVFVTCNLSNDGVNGGGGEPGLSAAHGGIKRCRVRHITAGAAMQAGSGGGASACAPQVGARLVQFNVARATPVPAPPATFN
eukprot:364867-Chlamydomonas_euryale.AAC.4